jgi:hypothetical protein
VKIKPGRSSPCFGKILVAISTKREMIRIFERVPNPGRSLSGIQRARTSEPTINVDVPIDRPLLRDIP